MSGKQDSNLRPPASKTGKQPPLSFQFCRFILNFFSERQSEPKYSVNLAVYARIELAVPKRQSGRLAITSIDLFVIPRGLFMNFILYFMAFTNTLYFEPLTLGLENPCPIQLSYGTFIVIPERFELSTPGLKDRCSNHLSYEILYLGYLRGSNPVLRFHRPALYQIS